MTQAGTAAIRLRFHDSPGSLAFIAETAQFDLARQRGRRY